MKTFGKNLLMNKSPNSSTQDSISSLLQDSISSLNLIQTSEQKLKFRETINQPSTTRNFHRESLRCTVNTNKIDKNIFANHTSPIDGFKLKRKLTIPDEFNSSLVRPESPVFVNKPNSARKKIEKKTSNPESKEGIIEKQGQVPKFLEKKIELIKECNSKTERTPVSTNISRTPKKMLTPKYVKDSDERPTMCKNVSSYSSSDLRKLKHKQSLQCETYTQQSDSLLTGPKISDFKMIKFLGEGRFGQVHLGLHKETNTIFAIKQIKKDGIAKNKMEDQLLMEIKMQLFFNHPNILKLYGVFSDLENVFLILEYMEEGTLYSELKKKKTLKQNEASRKLRDVIDGVKYLHGQMIAHRDIKPENIVISYDVCKICDLGWAAICEDRRKTMCGTIDYASPELLEGKEYGLGIDLWCLGVLCYELMVGKCPFYHISRKETMKKIINTDTSDINLPSNLSIESKDFISRLIVRNPEERMTADWALKHTLITKHIDEDMEDVRGIKKKH